MKLVRDADTRFHRYGNEIATIRDLINGDWDCQIFHTFREENSCADLLAKKGSNGSDALVLLNTPPSDLSPLLLSDARGTVFVRL